MAKEVIVEWIECSYMDVCTPALAGSNPKDGDSMWQLNFDMPISAIDPIINLKALYF